MKNLVYCFGLNAILLLFVTISLDSSVPAQKDEKPKREKFGWSLKKKGKELKTDSKPKEQNGKKEQNGNIDEDEKILVNTDLILNDILVLNQKGEAVFGLKQSDFVVIEDGKPQEIELFSSPDKPSTLPRYFVFIIDHSNSQVGHMRNSIDAAELFVDKLAPQDKMAIVSDDVKLIQDFTNDKAKLKKKLESVYKDYASMVGRWGGWGLNYTALFTVLNEMFDEENIRPIVILQSIGGELYSLKGGKRDASRSKFGLYYGYYNFTYQELLTKIVEKRATVYSIVTGRRFAGLSDEEKIENLVLMQMDNQYDGIPVKLKSIEPLDKATDNIFVRRIMQESLEYQLALIEIAETSGGTINFLQTPEDAKTIYSDIFSSVNNRYLIAYYSTNQEQNKQLRNVKIEVRGHPEYVIVGRKTYLPR
jgi:VWFA-related protein